MRVIGIAFVIAALAASANAALFGGVEFPGGAISFADEVVSYQKGTWAGLGYDNPSRALGEPDSGDLSVSCVSLGNNGTLILGFTDNYLITSGDPDDDLWIFEGGPGGEQTAVSISIDGSNWIDVGIVNGPGGIDIDTTVSSGFYSYIKLYDVGNLPSTQPWAGSDINAVGAISTVPEPATMSLLVIGGLAMLRRRWKT